MYYCMEQKYVDENVTNNYRFSHEIPGSLTF